MNLSHQDVFTRMWRRIHCKFKRMQRSQHAIIINNMYYAYCSNLKRLIRWRFWYSSIMARTRANRWDYVTTVTGLFIISKYSFSSIGVRVYNLKQFAADTKRHRKRYDVLDTIRGEACLNVEMDKPRWCSCNKKNDKNWYHIKPLTIGEEIPRQKIFPNGSTYITLYQLKWGQPTAFDQPPNTEVRERKMDKLE